MVIFQIWHTTVWVEEQPAALASPENEHRNTHTRTLLKCHFTGAVNTNRLQLPHVISRHLCEAGYGSPTEPTALLDPLSKASSKFVISKKAWRRKGSPFHNLWFSQLCMCSVGVGSTMFSRHRAWDRTVKVNGVQELSGGCCQVQKEWELCLRTRFWPQGTNWVILIKEKQDGILNLPTIHSNYCEPATL